ncbi:hypothetical protein GMLC_10540 [Geomonas limicola]|uniref:AAA+ ATPase domain-containing protein n=1 Tax=Geomonas limicola TaxID=2740186 RepID=A0A6V8N4K4_9BACT|nr:AAA family ATPase [Geomonas limicola]GFO67475.1 hypothetical protein GMLC_10540 [Geomonas limicola]
MNDLFVYGVPESVDRAETAIFNSRIIRACNDLRQASGDRELSLRISSRPHSPEGENPEPQDEGVDEDSLEEKAARYLSVAPLWRMDQLVAPQPLLEELENAVRLIELEPLIFDAWGLREIEPFPRSALNFHGPPGTGKTLSAHAVAAALGKGIIVASYAQIESKYHGDGPKNVEALFHAAQRDGSVLFIDEADSLLSRRLTNVTQGSEQAINSMRSQILICLERFRGVVIFATNLVENYDPAFETRVRHIRFRLPDADARQEIWRRHLPSRLPLADDVDLAALSQECTGFCGREIKNAVIDAAFAVGKSGRTRFSQEDFTAAVRRLRSAQVTATEIAPADAPTHRHQP